MKGMKQKNRRKLKIEINDTIPSSVRMKSSNLKWNLSDRFEEIVISFRLPIQLSEGVKIKTIVLGDPLDVNKT